MRNFSERPHIKGGYPLWVPKKNVHRAYIGMARIRRARRRYKRRLVRKFKRYVRRGDKRGWRSRRTGRKKLVGGNPNKKRIVFAFSSRVEFSLPAPNNTGGTNQAAVTIQGNNLTDINPVGAGIEQPQDFDQWAAFYRIYRVIACKLELEIIPVLAVDPALGPIEILIIPCQGTDNAYLLAEAFSITAARPYVKKRVFNVGQDTKVLNFKHFAHTKTITYANGNEVFTSPDFAGFFPPGAGASVAPVVQWGFLVKAQYIRFSGTISSGVDFVLRYTTRHYTQMEARVFNGPSGNVN